VSRQYDEKRGISDKERNMNESKEKDRAREIHERAIVIDGHSDILIPITEGKMSLDERIEIPDAASWIAPPGLERHPLVNFGALPHTVYFGCMGQYDIPRFVEGGLSAQVCAIYLDDDKLTDPLRHGLEMTWHFRHAVDAYDVLELVSVASDIPRLKQEGRIGAILGLEGCEALGSDIRFLELYHTLGLRIASLTHVRRNIYADGCWAAQKQGGLTELGKELIRKMNALGIVIDLVHIGEHGFWEILDLTKHPLILSHSTPTMFPNSDPDTVGPFGGKIPRPRLEFPRDRAVLEALAQNDGVLGITWVCHADIDDVIADIESALEVMGPDRVGLGSDLYGAESAPRGLEDISKVPSLTEALVRRGHSEETITKFLGANYMRVFERVWG
jgi:membrane dipeptidase